MIHPFPRDWDQSKLGLVSTIRYGLGVPPKACEGGIPMIRATNIKRGRIVADGLMRIRADDVPNGRNALLSPGEIIVVRSGAYTGDSALVTPEWAGAVIGYDLVVSPNSNIHPAYLAMWMLGQEAHIYFRGQRDRSAQPHLNRHQLSDAVVTLPPLDEQRQIAAVLSAVQRAIERQERLIALTAELKKALMHKLFAEGTRGEPLKQTEIGPLPKTWKVVDFETFSTLQRGQDLPKSTFRPGKIPVIGATMIGFHDTANVKGPGVAVVRSGSSAGKALYIPQDFWAHNVVLHVKEFRGNYPKFVYYKLHSLDLTRFKAGVAVPTLNRNTFRTMKVGVPELAEQLEIAATLDSVENRMRVAEQTLATLSDLFRTLLHELMTAQIRVDDLDLSALEKAGRGPGTPTDNGVAATRR